jgi:UDP-GlcNAc:undecaprenyl-phosphate GlcNAc-1-phosphate transferase
VQQFQLVNFLILGFAALTAVGLLTPIMRRIAIRFQIVDQPTESHKMHIGSIPYLGGVAIILGVVLVTFTATLGSQFDNNVSFLASTILAPAILLGVIGLIDDIHRLKPWPRFLMQTISGLGISFLLVITDTLGSPFGNSWIDIPLTSLWIVGITNSINFFDNVDGGASGTVGITSITLFFLSWQGGQDLIAAMSIVLGGATLGFLIWNKPPARIYMGDAGALFLGVLIASLTTRFNPNPIDKIASYSIPILLLAVPILDTSVAVISRIMRGISPFQGGTDHVSHRLMRSGHSKPKAISILWLMSSLFSLTAIAISYAPYPLERYGALFAGLCWIILFCYFIRLKPLRA